MKPILFSTPMVQAILDGRKTMTRRIVKTDGEYFTDSYNYHIRQACFVINGKSTYINYPFDVGDVLWVRETWTYGRVVGESDEYGNSEFWLEQTQKEEDEKCIFYKADMDDAIREDISFEDVFWKPSIFMPKEYARIFLRVTNVRVERLQDISDEDCEKEGCRPSVDGDAKDWLYDENGWHRTFRQLWNSINGKGAWEANPYVFVYTFQRVEKPL